MSEPASEGELTSVSHLAVLGSAAAAAAQTPGGGLTAQFQPQLKRTPVLHMKRHGSSFKGKYINLGLFF